MESNLTPDQWGAAWRLYEALAELPESDRERLLESSAEDPAVIRQVRTLLENGDGQIPAEPVLRTGSQVSHYSVGERIGRGGMGEVYEARDLDLDRPVAIKFLPAHMLDEDRAVRRFLAEAKATSALNHPNLVTIHEFVRQDGLLAIVMERIDGRTLRRMPPVDDPGGAGLRECLRRLAQLAEALAAAHAQGIIHRDLKPENIMVRADGYVKILDFGLAVLAERAVPVPGGGTAFSTAAGTPLYMSPEQKRNQPLTPASDVYSLGLVFLEMLTGSADPAGLSALSSRVPGNVARLVSSMLAPDAAARPSAAAVAREAARLDTARRHWPWWTAVALVGVLAAVGLWRPSPAPAPAPAWSVLPLTALPGEELGPRLSPDGEQVAFSWNGERGDNTDIYVMRLRDRSVRRLTTHPAEDASPIWSPDGKTIAFARHTGPISKKTVYLLPAEGGPERPIGEAYGPQFGDWSPDGRWLVVRGGPGLALIDVRTGEARPLLEGDGPAYVTPAFSPDGRRLAFSRDKLGIAELMILPLTADARPAGPAQAVRLAGFRAEEAANPRWTADGRSLVFTFSRGGTVRLWQVRLPEDLAQEVTPEVIGVGNGISSASFSGVARRLVFAQARGDANLWRIPLEGGVAPQKWVTSSRDDRKGDVRADGRIVFESDRSGFREIWVTEPDGTGGRALTNFGGPMAGSPRWSPDGRTIAFDTRKDGNPEIYALDVPGPGEPFPLDWMPAVRRVTHTGKQNVVPAWSPDGKWIYFQSLQGGTERIARAPAGGGNVQPVSPGFGRSPIVSPDGKWVYYARLGDYWRCPADGGPEEPVAQRIVIRSFVPVPGGLWFLRSDANESRIVYRDAKSGVERIAARYPGRTDPGLSLTLDRKYAIVTRLEEGQADLMMVENFDPR